jgi:hypothetical protein
MANKQPIELFMPPNMLKAKVGGTIRGGLDMAAIARAESAVETLKSDFAGWVGSDVDRLCTARDLYAAKRESAARDELLRASHDIKGQAATFEYPLVARVAASLCKLIESVQPAESLPLVLVDAHVTAIRIIFRDKIKDASNRMALELAEELEARVTEAEFRA